MPEFSLKIPAIEQLLDYVASGVGAIAGPMLAPWRATREANARLASARINAEAKRIEAETEAETSVTIAKARQEAREYLVAPNAEIHGTAEFTREDIVQRIQFQEHKRLMNVRSVVGHAADELGEREVADHEPDPDWTARFFDCVQDVSSEDMQKLWARVLAGEVESPGRTSLRTLDSLKNLTKRDAEMFMGICQLVMGGSIVFYHDSVKGLSALAFNNLLHLQDCNLIYYQPNLVSTRQWEEDNCIVLNHQNDALLVTSNDTPNGPLEIPAIRLTASGAELARLSSQPAEMVYLRAFSTFLKSKNCQLEYLDGVERLSDGSIQYESRIVIDSLSE